MATELGKAYVQIIPSAKGIGGSIKGQLDPEAASAGSSAGESLSSKLISVVKAAIVTAGIGKAIGASITEGAKLQQSLGGVETIFKKSAGKVKQYASQAYRTAGMSANDYMENVTSFSSSLLQSLGGNTGKAAKVANMAMIDMSDNANKFGSNMGDIQNAYQGFAKQNYTMLDNLKLGYGGTKEEMERLLKDATKLTGKKYDISNLSDVYNAIHAIQGKLDITGTTAKEAATTFSGSFDSMKAAAQNVLGNIALGRDIEPSLKALAQTTSNFLFNNFIPMVGNILKALPGALVTFIDAAIPLVKSGVSNMFKSAFSGSIDFASYLKPALAVLGAFTVPAGLKLLGGVFSKLSFVVKPLGGIFSGFGSVLKPITGIFSGLGGIVKTVASSFSSFATAILKIGAGIGAATLGMSALAFGITALASTGTAGITAMATFGVVIGGLAAVFALLAPALTAGSSGITAFGTAILAAGVGIGVMTAGIALMVSSFALLNMSFVQLTTVSTQLVPLFVSLGVGFASMITSFLSTIVMNMPTIIQSFVTLGTGILNAINTLMPQLIATGMNMIMSLLNGINANIGQIISVSVDIIVKFIGGLAQGLPKILAKGVEFIVNLFTGIAQNLPKIITAAVNVVTSFIGGIANNLGKIVASALNLVTKFANAIISNQGRLATAATKIIQAFVTSVGTAMGVILGSGTKLIGWFVSGLLQGLSKSRSAGKSNANAVKDGARADLTSNGSVIMSSFLGGLHSKWGAVKSFVGGIGSWIKAHKGPISYDKKLLIPAGQAIMGGLNNGLSEAFKDVKSNVNSMAGFISDEMDASSGSFGFNPGQISKVTSVDFNQASSASETESTIVSQLNEMMSLLSKDPQYQVMLDSGVLAGQLTPKVDSQLANNWRKNDNRIGR
ncbi:phage tail protein [Companilactobacillus kimchii]|uniref:Tmp n=2 Tax=Companilactobacillus kimchii TaxID=2801452 RepID=A0ABR5NW95_9LACO|nr:hypothetical protein [Companilactobacillus kimchii]KAE9561286.1 hypothetical protein ATN91_07550 [Companilactobacillus kimchii]KRK53136.1 tmp [Companilactobacillus kimchii DSM 13961 = JCM 10707]OWF32813.1 Tape measure protein [Companilactobacillus kimchii]GEO48460.1 hypothetical protein LKI01_24590 [Companilactobacillus paralimentarius]